ncbi:MAG TPA: phytoene desaturase family protein [Spirochaetota bacterium]|nr:phytoene desaturase family protein [Spirochaetota bacterium]
MSSEKAVIIGAGAGGLALAILLRRQGYAVTVFEKNSCAGGRVGRIENNGHIFDTGATLFLLPDFFRELFKDMGFVLEEELELTAVNPTSVVHFADGASLRLSSNMEIMRSQLQAYSPKAMSKYLALLHEGSESYRLAIPGFIKKNFYSAFDFFTLQNIFSLYKTRAWQTHFRRAAKYFRHPHLRAAFTYQDIYVGLSPFTASAVYSLFPYMELAGGLYFPRGGMYAIMQKLLAIGRQNGVEFFFNRPVSKILIKDKKAAGVVCTDETSHAASLVAANADLPYVYDKLLPAGKRQRRIKQKKYAAGALTFYFNVERCMNQLRHQHNVFLGSDYKRSFAAIFTDNYLADTPPFYLNLPARTHNDNAPPGKDTVMAVVPCGNIDPDRKTDWNKMRNQARSYILKRLSQKAGFNVEQYISREQSFTPVDWQERCNVYRGAVFGSLAHTIRQVAWFRPANRHPDYKNLYFTGASTHPGAGVPMVLLSARLTAARIKAGK